jgi:hypothetical protein
MQAVGHVYNSDYAHFVRMQVMVAIGLADCRPLRPCVIDTALGGLTLGFRAFKKNARNLI